MVCDEASTGGEAATTSVATRAQIVAKIKEFSARLKSSRAKCAFFHYSGHGIGFADSGKGDKELDSRDEFIVTGDNKKIQDDYLHKLIVDNIPDDCVLFAVMDCCHSGSILDLPWRWEPRGAGGDGELHVEGVLTSPGVTIAISGCKDSQTSADIYNREEGQSEGALSGTLYRVMETLPGMKSWVEYDGKSLASIMSEVHTKLRAGRYAQRPQLSCSLKLGKDTTMKSLIHDTRGPELKRVSGGGGGGSGSEYVNEYGSIPYEVPSATYTGFIESLYY